MAAKFRSYIALVGGDVGGSHKFDILGRTEREERKKDDTLEMFRELVKLSHRLDLPDFPPGKGNALW